MESSGINLFSLFFSFFLASFLIFFLLHTFLALLYSEQMNLFVYICLLTLFIFFEENMKGLVHILDVRDWILSLYSEKCGPLLLKLSSSIIPELCPHFGRYYKSMFDDCEKKMYLNLR